MSLTCPLSLLTSYSYVVPDLVARDNVSRGAVVAVEAGTEKSAGAVAVREAGAIHLRGVIARLEIALPDHHRLWQPKGMDLLARQRGGVEVGVHRLEEISFWSGGTASFLGFHKTPYSTAKCMAGKGE